MFIANPTYVTKGKYTSYKDITVWHKNGLKMIPNENKLDNMFHTPINLKSFISYHIRTFQWKRWWLWQNM